MQTQPLSHSTISSHLRALYALIRKDWKQYWRYPLNAVSSVFQPLIWIVPIYFMGQTFSVNGKALGFSQYSGTTDFMSFILIGTVLESFINAVFWGMGYALKNDMDSGVMESNWLTPIPRLLILIQVLWIYVSAGMNKSGAEWGPIDGFRALANAVCDPHIARVSCGWVISVLPLTQVATALSMVFELSAPLYLVYLYCDETADRPGRLRRIVNRLRLRWIWLALGIAVHAGIAVFLRLGAFPWGMLALYPALLLPRDLRWLDRD